MKGKFDTHNLIVNTESIRRLFKSAAVDRFKGDPCKALTFYEFCLFSNSEKAAKGFQGLMEKLKNKTVRNSELDNKKRSDTVGTDPQSLIPVRGSSYVKNLPSSFNALMDHLSEEETRNDMREEAIKGLEKILNAENPLDINTDDTISSSINTMKTLMTTHFPKQQFDDQYRRLISQWKSLGDTRRKLTFAKAAENRNSIIGQNLLLKRLGRIEDTKDYLARKKKELEIIIARAKSQGKKEADILIRRYHNVTNPIKLNELSKQSETLKNQLTFPSRTANQKERAKYRNKAINDCLNDNLLLRKTVSGSNMSIPFTSDSNYNYKTVKSIKTIKVHPKLPGKYPKCYTFKGTKQAKVLHRNFVSQQYNMMKNPNEDCNISPWCSK